jgi:phosphonate transport system ATP-binding protein
LLGLRQASVTYPGGRTALRPADIQFAEGRITVLLGPSGAGKSSILRLLNGLVSPTQGHVVRTGIGSLDEPRALRAHRLSTAMIFQQHHLIGRLTVLDNALLGRLGFWSALQTILPPSRRDRLLALAALDRVGLAARALDRADGLSGGEQQRVGIARAMAQQPSILLADEPIASLDPAAAERLLSDLRRICRDDGLTAVVSLHQVEFARRFADRIVGVRLGRIVFDGPPAALDAHAVDEIYGVARPAGALAAE